MMIVGPTRSHRDTFSRLAVVRTVADGRASGEHTSRCSGVLLCLIARCAPPPSGRASLPVVAALRSARNVLRLSILPLSLLSFFRPSVQTGAPFPFPFLISPPFRVRALTKVPGVSERIVGYFGTFCTRQVDQYRYEREATHDTTIATQSPCVPSASTRTQSSLGSR